MFCLSSGETIGHSSPRPSVKCRFGRSIAGLDFFLFLSPGLGAAVMVLKWRFRGLKCRFCRENIKINISREALRVVP